MIEKKEHKLVMARSAEELDKQITSLRAEGWLLRGYLHVRQETDRFGAFGYIFFQAMIRTKQAEE